MRAEDFFGRAWFRTISSNGVILRGQARLQVVSAFTTSLHLSLPDATTLKVGGPHWLIIGVSANSFDVQDADGNVIATVAQNNALLLALGNNTTTAGSWFARLATDVVSGAA